jgi:hypothetical protein
MSKTDKRDNIIMVYVVLSSLDNPISCRTLLQIASEPLTFEKADWMEIRTNNMVVITSKMNLLQIPIMDQFYVTPSDPAALARATDFAEAKGLLNPRRSLQITVQSSKDFTV